MRLFRYIFGKSTPTRDEAASSSGDADISAPTPITSTPSAPTAHADSLDYDDDLTDEIPVAVAGEDTISAPYAEFSDGTTRPLKPETVISSRNGHITFGQTTDTGMVRTNNQDAVLSVYVMSESVDTYPDFGLFIVADGMGGHLDGEKAAALTTRSLATNVMKSLYLPMVTTQQYKSVFESVSDILITAVQKANAKVIENVPNGGTTLTAVVVIDDLAHFAHVGDSRCYLITKEGEIEQLTRDHSLVQRLIELDQISLADARHHPQKNVLYRAIGQSESIEIDTLTRRLPAGSWLLLCSDGLWGHVEEDDLRRIVLSEQNPQAVSDQLVALANTRGGLDNITAIILKVPSR